MKEYYKIGEISKLYGIGTDSLRYYEELGILHPRRDSNGYRMYSISDIRTLNILRELRSIGFSMQEIKEHLQEDFAFDCPRISFIPERKILKLSESVYRDEDLDFVLKELQKKNQDQLYIIGNGSMGAVIPLEPISKGIYGHFSAVFSLVGENEDYDTVIPAGNYLGYTVRGSYSKMEAGWKTLFTELSRRKLTPSGNPMEFYIIDNHDTNREEEFITHLQIPV